MALNLVAGLVYVGLTHFDPDRPGDLRIANAGIVLVVWTLANVINTNQLGSDSQRTVSSLEDGDRLTRILAIKNISLATLLIPVAVATSVLVRLVAGHWSTLPHAVVEDVGAVFLWLGVGCIASVVLPYPPIKSVERWRRRRKSLRWVFCQLLPYAIVFLVMPFLHIPYDVIYRDRAVGPYHPHLMLYSAIYLAIGVSYWLVGLAISSSYGRANRSRLIADLRRSE